MEHDSGDVGVFQSHASYQDQKDLRNYFWRVIRGYRDVSELSPLVAMTWDPRGRLWVLELYEYPLGAKNGEKPRDRRSIHSG